MQIERGGDGKRTVTLAGRLQRLLAARHCTITEAADASGMPKQQVWRIVTGKVENPGVITVQRLVEALGGTLGELFADEP